MNEIPSLIAAGPAVVIVLSWTCVPKDSDWNEAVTGLLRRHCGLATLPGERVSSRNNYSSCSRVSMREITETQKTVGCHRYDLRL